MKDLFRLHKNIPREFRITRRRGLTTVVTTALMLSTVAVLGSSLVAWSNGNLKVFETALSTTATNDTNQVIESMSIENIAFCSNCNATGSNNVINVTLTNTGTEGITVKQIQINDTTIQQFAKDTSLPATILPHQSYTVAAQLPSDAIWKSKELDTISVTTARGSIYTTESSPP